MNSKVIKIGCAMLLLAFIVTFFQGAQSAEAASLADGTYTIDYEIKKPEDDSASMANDYWEKPATVIVSGGAITVRMTINHSEWVTQFKVPSGSSYVDAKIISQNSDKNTRLVQFSLGSLEKDMLSKIHVTVPEIDYDHDYTIRFVYNVDSLKLISEPESQVTPAPAAKPQPTAAATAKETESSTGNTAVSEKESPQPHNATVSASKEPAAAATTAPSTTSTSTATSKPDSQSSEKSSREKEAGDQGSSNTAAIDEQDAKLSEKDKGEQKGNEAELESEAGKDSAAVGDEESALDAAGSADQKSVELTSALDSASTDAATAVAAASIAEESNKSYIVVIIVSLVIAACAAIAIMYRKRKAKNS